MFVPSSTLTAAFQRSRHFRARFFPRPFLAGWVWGPDYPYRYARVYCSIAMPGAPEEGVNVYEYGCVLIQECGWISVGWARSRMQDPTIALGLSAVVLSVIITTTECGR